MSAFQTVVIEPHHGHYRVRQGEQVLFAVPRSVFELFEADDVFPPHWSSRREIHPVRRLYWNPESREFLMAGLEAHPARTAETHGSDRFRAFLQAFWVPSPPLLVMRPYWNPADPDAPFDAAARTRSLDVQRQLCQALGVLRPPRGWATLYNATAPYLDALGIHAQHVTAPADRELLQVSLTPPQPLADDRVEQVFVEIATRKVGTLFPLVRAGAWVAVHALTLPELHDAQLLLDTAGLDNKEGSYRPH